MQSFLESLRFPLWLLPVLIVADQAFAGDFTSGGGPTKAGALFNYGVIGSSFAAVTGNVNGSINRSGLVEVLFQRHTSLAMRDQDGDGMSDQWEMDHGLNPSVPSPPGADADGDGVSDYEEFIAGSHPSNGTSVFRVQPTFTPAGVTLAWSTSIGRSYRIDHSENLVNWVPVETLAGTGTPFQSFYATAPQQSSGFYRVIVFLERALP